MNTEKFTGKAQAYTNARPGYPDAAIDYIRELVPHDAIFADIGAGTGKFTELLARYRYDIYAVEPNADMREQLKATLSHFQNVKIIASVAESTTLPDCSVDVIICAQALGWFNLNAFRTECRRIGKFGVIVISIYNEIPGDNSISNNNRLTSKQATELFFKNPTVREFPNPIFYTRDRWFQYMASISDNPQPSDSGYDSHIAEMNEIFDRESVGGMVRREFVTKVYSERVE